MAQSKSVRGAAKKSLQRRKIKVIPSKISNFADESRTEAALKSSDERLAIIQEATGIGLWEWDVVANTSYCSAECGRLHGVSAGNLPITSEQWLARFHPADRERSQQETIAAL